MKNRVVVTGLGIISPVGNYPGKYWQNLINGVNGISDVEIKGYERCYSKKYGLLDKEEIRILEDKYLSGNEHDLPEYAKIAVIAASMAAGSGNITFEDFEDKMKTGVFLGTASGDLLTYYEDERRLTDKFTAPFDIARHFDIHGCISLNTDACTAGNQAVSTAAAKIRSGELDTAFVGGSDCYSIISYVIFNRLKVLSPDTLKPFDANRNGTILSEGSAFLILENLDHARRKEHKILGEILGTGITNDAYNIVSPDPSGEGIINAMELAIHNSGITPNDVEYIAVHGTGTHANDKTEAYAIEKVFESHTKEMYASSIKSNIGHQLGAASATAIATDIIIFLNNELPPTMNTDSHTDIPFRLVTKSSVKKKVDIIMNNAYAFGGGNCSIILKRWDENNE